MCRWYQRPFLAASSVNSYNMMKLTKAAEKHRFRYHQTQRRSADVLVAMSSKEAKARSATIKPILLLTPLKLPGAFILCSRLASVKRKIASPLVLGITACTPPAFSSACAQILMPSRQWRRWLFTAADYMISPNDNLYWYWMLCEHGIREPRFHEA